MYIGTTRYIVHEEGRIMLGSFALLRGIIQHPLDTRSDAEEDTETFVV